MLEVYVGAVNLSPYFRERSVTSFNFQGIPKPLLKELELLTTTSLNVSFLSPDCWGLFRWSMAQPANEKGEFFVTLYDKDGNYITLLLNGEG